MISIRKTSKPVSLLLLLAFTAAMFISTAVDTALTSPQSVDQLSQDDGQGEVIEAGLFGWLKRGIKKVIKIIGVVSVCVACGLTNSPELCDACKASIK